MAWARCLLWLRNSVTSASHPCSRASLPAQAPSPGSGSSHSDLQCPRGVAQDSGSHRDCAPGQPRSSPKLQGRGAWMGWGISGSGLGERGTHQHQLEGPLAPPPMSGTFTFQPDHEEGTSPGPELTPRSGLAQGPALSGQLRSVRGSRGRRWNPSATCPQATTYPSSPGDCSTHSQARAGSAWDPEPRRELRR